MVLTTAVVQAFHVLGLTPDTPEDIARNTYKKLALVHHPDRNRGDPSATERFQQIGAAWTVCQRYYDDPTGSDGSNPITARTPYDDPYDEKLDTSDEDIPLDNEQAEAELHFWFRMLEEILEGMLEDMLRYHFVHAHGQPTSQTAEKQPHWSAKVQEPASKYSLADKQATQHGGEGGRDNARLAEKLDQQVTEQGGDSQKFIDKSQRLIQQVLQNVEGIERARLLESQGEKTMEEQARRASEQVRKATEDIRRHAASLRVEEEMHVRLEAERSNRAAQDRAKTAAEESRLPFEEERPQTRLMAEKAKRAAEDWARKATQEFQSDVEEELHEWSRTKEARRDANVHARKAAEDAQRRTEEDHRRAAKAARKARLREELARRAAEEKAREAAEEARRHKEAQQCVEEEERQMRLRAEQARKAEQVRIRTEREAQALRETAERGWKEEVEERRRVGTKAGEREKEASCCVFE